MKIQHDHGTLLLDDLPREHLEAFRSARLDPRVRRLRAPGHAYGAVLETARASGIDVQHDDVAAARLAPPSLSCRDALEASLRPYQRQALAGWELAARRGVVVLPTGAGKTRVGLAAIARGAAPSLVVVPTRALLEQWHRALGAGLETPIARFGDGAHELGPITVATYASALRHASTLAPRFGLLVVDEAHHFGDAAMDEILETSTASLRLGLTATPPEGPEAVRLSELVGPIVCDVSVHDLAGRWLAPFDQLVLRLPLTREERREHDASRATFKRWVESLVGDRERTFHELAREAQTSPEGRAAMMALRRSRAVLALTEAKEQMLARLLHQHRTSKTLVFVGTNEAAYRVARRFLVMPITCDIGRDERAKALARFAEGSLRVLVSARVLNEGIDVPDAEVAIVLGGVLGAREHVQRVGRVLRPSEGKRATIYELVSEGTREGWLSRERRRGLAPHELSEAS
ncbi:MAG: DEAD/DEAH box helicase family protein [Sandaracinaceae bacterium]|nr:DEAD/DEAH box helicase family protein [Sandaracinaceae bacterium]